MDEEKDLSQRAKSYSEKLREKADDLEILLDDELWRFPKYRELLLLR